jgi:membrane glycosyltransferase
MNKITKYIDALPLSEAEKAALPDTSLQAVHEALDAEHHFVREDDSPLGSVKRVWSTAGQTRWQNQLIKDDEGRTQLRQCRKQNAPQCSRTRGAPTRLGASGIVCADVM